MVGDRQDDIDLGNKAGTKTILIRSVFPVDGKGATTVVDSLLDAARYIIRNP
jgi:phosphoglycolate phosphatase-like HAD superfamily hydrolase